MTEKLQESTPFIFYFFHYVLIIANWARCNFKRGVLMYKRCTFVWISSCLCMGCHGIFHPLKPENCYSRIKCIFLHMATLKYSRRKFDVVWCWPTAKLWSSKPALQDGFVNVPDSILWFDVTPRQAHLGFHRKDFDVSCSILILLPNTRTHSLLLLWTVRPPSLLTQLTAKLPLP